MRSLIIRPIQAGFTLVELLIVVIIIAILAAIIVPQFSSSTTDAQEAALDANLAGLRSAVELYRVQHSNKYPGTISGALTCTGTAGATTGSQVLIDQMLLYSTAGGQTCSINDTSFRFGPYYRKDRGFPSDPITLKGSVAADITIQTAGTTLVSTVTTGGWLYDSTSGQIVMNSNNKDSKGNFYYSH